MFEAISSPYLVPFNGKFSIRKSSTVPPKDAPDKKKCKKHLKKYIDELDELQRVLYAHDKYALLLVFQAMD
ncbi:MAG: polyphosphate kinase 2 family protein, partial [Calditrichaeota bacterium]|nr:polyphosphate kinase 2 family protein [Calditrichota bacterium]